jgi:hypothetical protein
MSLYKRLLIRKDTVANQQLVLALTKMKYINNREENKEKPNIIYL